MINTETKPLCKNCRFFVDERQYGETEGSGQCRRYPRQKGKFSSTWSRDWCGEFDPKEAK